MSRKLMLWSILFAAGLLMVVCRMGISRYVSDVTALLAAGGILAAVSGAGVLFELYRPRR